MQGNAAIASNLGNLLDRLDRTRLIVRVHDRNQARLWPHRGGDRLRIDDATAIWRHVRRGEPLSLQGLRRVQHGVVLDGGGDDVRQRAIVWESEPRSPGDTAQGEVIALGRPTGEDDLTWLAAENASAGGARLVDRRARLLPKLIDAGGVPVPLREVGEHRGQYVRVEWGGRRVIEIDRVVHGVSQDHGRASLAPRRDSL